MTFAIIGHRKSTYTKGMIEFLAKKQIIPEYVILEDYNEEILALTAYSLSRGEMPPK